MNETFNVRKYSDRYLNIGNNGGGEAFILDLESPNAVFLVGHGSMHPDDFQSVSPSLSQWLLSDFAVPREPEGENYSRPVDVLVIAMPSSIADLMAIRKSLTPSLSISTLHERANRPPSVIARMPYSYYHAAKQLLSDAASSCITFEEVGATPET